MNKKKGVYAALALISQLGLSMLTPILLCVFVGVEIDERFGTSFTVWLILLGILAGVRNVYVLLRHTKKTMEDESDTDE